MDGNVERLSAWFGEESCGDVEYGEERHTISLELHWRDVVASDVASSAVDNDPWFDSARSWGRMTHLVHNKAPEGRLSLPASE
jgi:hypothetical protein